MSFIEFLANKCMSLDNEPYMITFLLIDLSHIEFEYYPFMNSLDKCNGSCNSLNDISMRICSASKTKDVNVKVFYMIPTRNDAKT